MLPLPPLPTQKAYITEIVDPWGNDMRQIRLARTLAQRLVAVLGKMRAR